MGDFLEPHARGKQKKGKVEKNSRNTKRRQRLKESKESSTMDSIIANKFHGQPLDPIGMDMVRRDEMRKAKMLESPQVIFVQMKAICQGRHFLQNCRRATTRGSPRRQCSICSDSKLPYSSELNIESWLAHPKARLKRRQGASVRIADDNRSGFKDQGCAEAANAKDHDKGRVGRSL